MSKIVFLKNKSEIYDGTFKQIGSNQVRITFDKIMPSNDILLSGFNLVNEYNKCVQTIREDYKYLYRTYEDDQMTVELCNDGIEYTPETVSQPEPYEPTPEELEAVFQQNKTNKIALSKLMLAEFLKNNPLHSSAHGGVEGIYSVTSEKQNLMMTNYATYQIAKSVNLDAKLTWNETGKSCTEWTEEEFLQLILEIKAYVYPLVSYQQKVEEEIYKCTTQEELEKISVNYNSIIK